MSNRTETIYKQRNKYFQIELRWYEWNRPGWVILCCLGFFVCFLVRLVRKVLLQEVTFDPGKWVKHLASIVACTPRVPLEVGVGCLKASEITRMTYLWPILIQNKCSPFLNKQRRAWLQEKITSLHQWSPQPIKLPSKCCKVEAPKHQDPRDGLVTHQIPWGSNQPAYVFT